MITMFQTPRGTRDFFPEKMAERNYVLNALRRVFERYGYDELDTPAFEDFALLAKKGGGGEEIKREIYYFKDYGERELGLRFDLTVPLARVVASNPNLPKPFKRYAIGKVWRYDEPQAGRYREFVQADVDVVGSSEPSADAEVIACACECLRELGFTDFTIRINNRKIIEGFLKGLSLEKEKAIDVFRSIDKLDKIGEEGVKKELEAKGIDGKKTTKILAYISGGSIEDAKKYSEEGAKELEGIFKALSSIGLDKYVRIDFSLVRGLEYYTGPVFELALGGKLSAAGGGRYDKLIELFGGRPTPATGISFGVERVIGIMEEKKMFSLPKTTTKAFVAPVKDEVREAAWKIASQLRARGVNCEADLMDRSLKKQLEYASAKGIPYCIVVGPQELKQNLVVLRDMRSGEEKRVTVDTAAGILAG